MNKINQIDLSYQWRVRADVTEAKTHIHIKYIEIQESVAHANVADFDLLVVSVKRMTRVIQVRPNCMKEGSKQDSLTF